MIQGVREVDGTAVRNGTSEKIRRLGASLAGAARKPMVMLVLLAVVGAVAFPAGVRAAGIQWADLTLEQALEKAAKEDRMVMVDVYSTHCGQCGELDEQVWDTPDGAALGQDLIALRIESGAPTSATLQKRYPILGLPAILFLRPDGEELGRIVGYRSPADFLDQANNLKSGIDPLPAAEADLAAHPNSLPVLAEVMELYLYQKRQDDAKKLLDRIMELDTQHTSSDATRSLTMMAKYDEYFLGDYRASLPIWKSLVELYASSVGVASGIQGSLKIAVSWNQTADWIDWICEIGEKHPDLGSLQYNIAIVSYHQGIRGHCLAEAARRAMALGVGPSNMGSIADALEGKPGPK